MSFLFSSGVVDAIPASAIHRNQMDEGSGTTAADSIGANDLTLSGPTWTSGIGNGGFYLDYDGTDDISDWASTPRTGSEDRTIALWVNPDALGANDTVVSIGSAATGERWALKLDVNGNGNLRVELEGSGYTTSLTLSTGGWQAIGLALSGSTLGDHLLYNDGATEQATGTETVNTGTTEQALGYSPFLADRNFDGGIDDPIWANAGWSASEFDEWRDATKDNYGL